MTPKQFFLLLGRYRARLQREDLYISRIERTLVNLQLDTTKHKPFTVEDFLMYGKPVVEPGEQKELLESNNIPSWKLQKMKMKAFTAGRAIALRRINDGRDQSR